jgi:23S rRNA (cytosine1962-C5)-methyltransferase
LAAGLNALILFEDEHLLVVHKPSGINTHKPDRFAPDGIHEWLKKREVRWANLSILHRLDKETSGVIVFGKTTKANQSLAKQFETHTVVKNYLLLSATKPTRSKFRAKSHDAITEFEFVEPHNQFFLIRAQPITGKTHQIRRHATENGFPVLGDSEYGGRPAPRLMLHAHSISFAHPATGERVMFEASVPRAFDTMDALVAAKEFRELFFDEQTNAFRLVSDAADGFSDVIVDSYAGNLLVQWQREAVPGLVERLREVCDPVAVFEQLATRTKRMPAQLFGLRSMSSESILICENDLNFVVRFGEGLSTGIFLDQRENRRRLKMMGLAGKSVLNCFAYTCAFSVAAAKAGAKVTSVDLSKNYLEWGRENFRANRLDPATHEFIFGDVFEWLKRFGKRGQTWDVVILDPPTFSTTKKGRSFRAQRDYVELNALAISLVRPGGALFCSTNQRTLAPDKFEEKLQEAAHTCGRAIDSLEFETQPFDFRVATGERPYLKTLWARLG